MIRFEGNEYETGTIELSEDSVFTIQVVATAKELEPIRQPNVEVEIEDDGITTTVNTTDYSNIQISDGLLILGFVDPITKLTQEIAQMTQEIAQLHEQVGTLNETVFPEAQQPIMVEFHVVDPKPQGVFYATDEDGNAITPAVTVDFENGEDDIYVIYADEYPPAFAMYNGRDFLVNNNGMIYIREGQTRYVLEDVHVPSHEILK